MRKGHGKEARLSYQRNLLTENRNGLIVGAEVAIGEGARALRATPHVIQSRKGRRNRIDGGTVRHAGYTVSVRRRPAMEGRRSDSRSGGRTTTRFRGTSLAIAEGIRR